MAGKSGWMGFGRRGSGEQTAKPLETSAKTCPNGHPLAKDWVECPYCKAAASASARSRVDPAAAGGGAAAASAGRVPPTIVNPPTGADPGRDMRRPPDAQAGGARRRTVVDHGQGSGGEGGSEAYAPAPFPPLRSHTVVQRADDDVRPLAQHRPGGGRKLRGVLITFSWADRLGLVFEVREGRNYIGSGDIRSDGNRPADVLIAEDGQLSKEHCLILCQRDRTTIKDCDSTNGTFVNGVQIDSLARELADGAIVQAGATVFTFQKVDEPPPDLGQRFEPDPDIEPEPEPGPGPRPRPRPDPVN